MKRFILYLTLSISALLYSWQQSLAQEYEELDYRDFKFYKEDEEKDISLWGGMNDSLIVESNTRSYTPNSRYALSYASNTYRGERLYKSRNLVGYTTVDYTTLRTLRGLGYAISATASPTHTSRALRHKHRPSSQTTRTTTGTHYMPTYRARTTSLASTIAEPTPSTNMVYS